MFRVKAGNTRKAALAAYAYAYAPPSLIVVCIPVRGVQSAGIANVTVIQHTIHIFASYHCRHFSASKRRIHLVAVRLELNWLISAGRQLQPYEVDRLTQTILCFQRLGLILGALLVLEPR